MTKAVRIENADMNTSKRIVIEVWQIKPDGEEELLVTDKLDFPTYQLTKYLHDSNYIVLKEEDIPS